MDRFGFLLEYLNESGGDNRSENWIITDDPDDCGIFFSQQPKEQPFYTKGVQDEIDFEGLFDGESAKSNVDYEPLAVNQKVKEIEDTQKGAVDVYCLDTEPISEDEKQGIHDIRYKIIIHKC